MQSAVVLNKKNQNHFKRLYDSSTVIYTSLYQSNYKNNKVKYRIKFKKYQHYDCFYLYCLMFRQNVQANVKKKLREPPYQTDKTRPIQIFGPILCIRSIARPSLLPMAVNTPKILVTCTSLPSTDAVFEYLQSFMSDGLEKYISFRGRHPRLSPAHRRTAATTPLYLGRATRTTRQSATAVSFPRDMVFTGHQQPITAHFGAGTERVRHRFWYTVIESGYPGGYECTSERAIVAVRPDKNERQRLRKGTCAAG